MQFKQMKVSQSGKITWCYIWDSATENSEVTNYDDSIQKKSIM